jgi:lysophospholipase L1-like esterase
MIERRSPPALGVGKKILFALIPVVSLLALSEVVLRATGVARACSPKLNAAIAIGRCHPFLGYTSYPGVNIGGHVSNSDGFRSREFGPKPKGVFRVVALGDSCTFGMTAFKEGWVAAMPYPQRLEQIAGQKIGPNRVDVLNAGIGGYNTFHGIMSLRTVLRNVEPDLITVRFGWNDHFWSPSAAGPREPSNAGLRALQDLLLRTEIYRLAMRIGNELRVDAISGGSGVPATRRPNATLEEFRHNLHRIVEVGTAMGAHVWLITTPDPFFSEQALQRYESLPPDAPARPLIGIHGLSSFRQLKEIHRRYAQVVREVGAELGVTVVDTAAIFDEMADETLFSLDDPVHPRQKGYDLEAEILYERLISEGLLADSSK